MLNCFFTQIGDSFFFPVQVFQSWHEVAGSVRVGCARFTRSRREIAACFERLALYPLPAPQLHFRWVIFHCPTRKPELIFTCWCYWQFFSVTEVQCLNDTQKYLRKIVHEIGLELRSTAMCNRVRRTRDGPFTLKDALTHQQWTASDVMQAVSQYHASKKRKKSPPTRINHTSATVQSQENRVKLWKMPLDVDKYTPSFCTLLHQNKHISSPLNNVIWFDIFYQFHVKCMIFMNEANAVFLFEMFWGLW